MDTLKTGDILLCHGYNNHGLDPGIDGLIEFATHSPWEHVAMVVKNPSWINKKLEDGLYVYQSSGGPNDYHDVIDGKTDGVTLNTIDDFFRNRKHVFVRSLNNFEFNNKALSNSF